MRRSPVFLRAAAPAWGCVFICCVGGLSGSCGRGMEPGETFWIGRTSEVFLIGALIGWGRAPGGVPAFVTRVASFRIAWIWVGVGSAAPRIGETWLTGGGCV